VLKIFISALLIISTLAHADSDKTKIKKKLRLVLMNLIEGSA
jgi:hypothetical protein